MLFVALLAVYPGVRLPQEWCWLGYGLWALRGGLVGGGICLA